jgi:hypothetical protein
LYVSAFVASALRASARALRALRSDFKRICHAPRGSKNNSRSRKIRFAVAKQQNPALRDSQSFFLAPKGELQSDNNSAKRNCPKAILLKK